MTASDLESASRRAFTTVLDNGNRILVRPVVKSDKPLIAQAIHDLSDRSRYLRFFAGFRDAPEPVLELLSSVDGTDHIAWGAMDLEVEGGQPIAAVHAVRFGADSPEFEISTTVLDQFHGHGISHMLLAAVAFDCMKQGATTAYAEVLPINSQARGLFNGLNAEVVENTDLIRYKMLFPPLLSTIEAKNHPRTLTEFMSELRAGL